MNQAILIVEDDQGIREYLRELLTGEGYSVTTAPDGTTALEKLDKTPPDLVLLDLKLPDISGESICRTINKDYQDTAVIMLTAKDASNDVVEGLNLGADDYITKPFEEQELLARVKARLRSKGNGGDEIKVGDLSLNSKTFTVKRDGKIISLTPQEYKLLEYLMRNANQVLTREMILNRIWLYSPDIETRVVDVYIGYLRKKIDKGHNKKLIHSVRGFGYTIKEVEEKGK